MPFEFDPAISDELTDADRCIEDRRDNPVRGRTTRFRLLQGNMLTYTFGDFVPGFAQPGINRLPFDQLVARPTLNARREGSHYFGDQFDLTREQIAKVEGDVFQTLEAAILWNVAARWNTWMAEGDWPAVPRYTRPTIGRAASRQIAVLTLPRRYDWVRLLCPEHKAVVQSVRDEIAEHDLLLPTSTPDIMVVVLPEEHRNDPLYRTEIGGLNRANQQLLERAYERMEDRIEGGEIILGIALKKSLRSDRLYQPLYEANIMQLLLEGRLGAPKVEFEVHTLESAGTAARNTYRAASLAGVATGHATPHRAIRDLYEPENADDLVRRFIEFLNYRMTLVGPGA